MLVKLVDWLVCCWGNADGTTWSGVARGAVQCIIRFLLVAGLLIVVAQLGVDFYNAF